MKRLLIFAIALFAAVACAPKGGEQKAKHVFVIAFDGWGSYAMESVNMPNTRAFMAEGCYTLQKRTVLPSDSAPNWASMFAGAPCEFHGWSNNGKGPDVKPIYLNDNEIFPTISPIDHQKGKTTERITTLSAFPGWAWLGGHSQRPLSPALPREILPKFLLLGFIPQPWRGLDISHSGLSKSELNLCSLLLILH